MATMELASIPRELPQFGRHLSSLARPASEVFGQQGSRKGKGSCGCGGGGCCDCASSKDSCGCTSVGQACGCGGGARNDAKKFRGEEKGHRHDGCHQGKWPQAGTSDEHYDSANVGKLALPPHPFESATTRGSAWRPPNDPIGTYCTLRLSHGVFPMPEIPDDFWLAYFDQDYTHYQDPSPPDPGNDGAFEPWAMAGCYFVLGTCLYAASRAFSWKAWLTCIFIWERCMEKAWRNFRCQIKITASDCPEGTGYNTETNWCTICPGVPHTFGRRCPIGTKEKWVVWSGPATKCSIEVTFTTAKCGECPEGWEQITGKAVPPPSGPILGPR
jgi:hypothetical protein